MEYDGVEKVRKAVDVIKEKSKKGEKISLGELSKEVGLSKWHLQRAFKRRIGISPREMGESLEKKQRQEGKGKEPAAQSEAEMESGVEGEMLFAFTPGSSEGLTDSKSSDVSSLPTPVPPDMAPNLDDMIWLTGYQADPVIPTPFEQDLNFAKMTDFDPDVEMMIRDLFPEIYDESVDTSLS